MPANEQLPYDKTSRSSIIAYAKSFIGTTLRKAAHIKELTSPKKNKGSFGTAVEYYLFHYNPNSDAAPDFKEVGMELKTTPLKRLKNGRLSAKERLVLTMINYHNVVNETWEHCSLRHKASDILIFSYLWEEGKDPLDYEIIVAGELIIPQADISIIKNDWEVVVNKIRAGRAHEISSSDTLYLEACTKASDGSKNRSQPFSDIPAKPRAWAFKASYMTSLSQGLINAEQIKADANEEKLPLLDLIRKRFSLYRGRTLYDLAESFHITKNGRLPKQAGALITKHILGISEDAKIEQFEKAGIKPKTLRIKKNGRPKEAISFPAFDYFKVATTPFEESDFYTQLLQKYLFVVFREDELGEYRLDDVVFWQMSDQDLEDAKACYEKMQIRINTGNADASIRPSENRCCHVRPHGRNGQDTAPTPLNGPQVKKSFWLNKDYIQEELKRIQKDA